MKAWYITIVKRTLQKEGRCPVKNRIEDIRKEKGIRQDRAAKGADLYFQKAVRRFGPCPADLQSGE